MRNPRKVLIVLLVLMYLVLFLHLKYEGHLGVIADEQGLDGGAIGIFGLRWPAVLLLQIAVIIGLHVAIYKRRKGE